MKTDFLVTVIGGFSYLLHPEPVGVIQETINPDTILPVTLLSTAELFNPNLDQFLVDLQRRDDVISKEFTFALVEKPGPDAANATKRMIMQPSKRAVFSTLAAKDDPSSALANLPTGPYILHGKNMHAAYKLYPDDDLAFTTGLIPNLWNETKEFFETLAIADNPVPVPSKLYYPPPSADKPLSGLRITIPENLAIKGSVTTVSSKDYAALYADPVRRHSEYVQRLVSQGAIIIGKTKASQFGSSRDWVDTVAPHNDRQDREQKPGGIDAGASNGLAGYYWYSYAAGQDGLHGLRDNAVISGAHSIRYSKNRIPQYGFNLASPAWSTPGLYTRNLTDLALKAPAFLNQTKADFRLPKRVIIPRDFFPVNNTKYQELYDLFVKALEDTLQVKAEYVSISDEWSRHPSCDETWGVENCKDLSSFLGDATFKAYCKDFYNSYEKFRADYKQKNGKEPSTEPDVAYQWAVGKNVTDADYTKYVGRMSQFGHWFSRYIMPIQSNSDKHAVMLLPTGPIGPQPADAPNPSLAINGLQPEILATIMGRPQMTSPFAQYLVPSDTSVDSHYAVAGSLLGAADDDLMLVVLMEMLFKQHVWRDFTQIGYQVFPVGNPPRNVDDKAYDPYPNGN